MQQIFSHPRMKLLYSGVAWQRILPIGYMLLLLALAPFTAIQRDLWTDEAFTASYTFYPTLDLVLEDVRRNEETPPIYFILIWLWTRVVGSSALALRAFSLLTGMLAVALFTHLAQRWLSRTEAVIAGALLTIAPLMVSYLIEARGYTLTLLCAIICIAAFENVFRQPESRSAYVGYVLSGTALFLTSYFGFALLLAHNVIWAASLIRHSDSRRNRLIYWVITQFSIGAIILPWLPSLLYQMHVAPFVTASWGNGVSDYYWLMLSLFMNAPPKNNWLLLWILLAAFMWGIAGKGLLRPWKHDGGLILRTFGVPTAMLLLLILWMQVVAPRYMIILLPGASLAAAAGWSALFRNRQRVGRALLGAAIVGMLVYRVAGLPSMQAIKPWSKLIPELEQRVQPAGDVVLFHPPWDQRIFNYYYNGPVLPRLGAQDYDTFYYEQGYQLRTTWTSDEAQAAIKGYSRVWVFYDPIFHQVPRLDLPYTQLGHWQADGLEMFLYELPADSGN